MTKIFISHSSTDTDFARQIAQALTEVGASVWIDVSDIRLGQNWSREVQRGLDACDVMILIVTPESMASENVENEWQYYFDEKKPVFTILWRPAKLHFQLRRLQYIDFHGQEFRAKFDEMIVRLRQQQIITTSSAQGQMHTIGSESKLPSLKGILPDPFEWCKVSEGKVTLEEGGYVPEGGQTFDVPAFVIAKYPITNAQYEVFVKAKDGYTNIAWWAYSDDAKRWRGENPSPKKAGYDGNDLPRTNVTWYESIAFCRWLSTRIAPLDDTSITLPTEQQWQRAAQGDDGRAYPWGNEFDAKKANTGESGIGQTTPVTQYPQGASPYGVMGTSGNVWEWCSTAYDTGSDDLTGTDRCILRGGSFHVNADYARCAVRDRYYPDSWVRLDGFRVVVGRPLH